MSASFLILCIRIIFLELKLDSKLSMFSQDYFTTANASSVVLRNIYKGTAYITKCICDMCLLNIASVSGV